jgi:plastocyanin
MMAAYSPRRSISMTEITRRDLGLGLAGLGIAAALPARAAATHAVSISNFKFDPEALTIAAGDTVTFTNTDSAPHTAPDDAGGFDTGKLAKGKSGDLTFASKGEFHYHCDFHRNMKGVITVG